MNTIEIEREDILAICDDKARRIENARRGINSSVAFHSQTPISKSIPSKPTGVYVISHRTYGIKYIGSGNIEERRAQHTRIFKNDGNPKLYVSSKGNTSKVSSGCGWKMYELDPELSNWMIQWVPIDSELMEGLEMAMIKKYNPSFNIRKKSKTKVILSDKWFKW